MSDFIWWHFSLFICVCGVGHRCMGACAHGGLGLMLGIIILYHSSTLFIKAGCLNRTQSSSIRLVLLLDFSGFPSLLSKTGTITKQPHPPGVSMSSGGLNSVLHTCVASVSTIRLSYGPCPSVPSGSPLGFSVPRYMYAPHRK